MYSKIAQDIKSSANPTSLQKLPEAIRILTMHLLKNRLESMREEESIKLGGGRLINYIYRSVDGLSDYKLVGNNCVSTTMKSIKEGVIEGNLTFQTALTLTALQQAVSPWEVKKILEIDYQLYNGDGLVISRIVGKAYTDEENN